MTKPSDPPPPVDWLAVKRAWRDWALYGIIRSEHPTERSMPAVKVPEPTPEQEEPPPTVPEPETVERGTEGS